MQQDFLVLNVIGYLGIKRYQLHRDGFRHNGKNFERGQIWGTPTADFLRSDDKNFRPTSAVFGADGALYVSDWSNAIIGHMQHSIRDPFRDHSHGRIYRIVYKGRPLQKKVAIAGQPIPRCSENLKNPVDGVRQRTRVELSGRNSKEVIAATRQWMKQFDPEKPEDAHALLEALWLHQQHNVRDQALLDVVLNSPEPHARIAAATVKHLWGPADPTRGKMADIIEQCIRQSRGQSSRPPERRGRPALHPWGRRLRTGRPLRHLPPGQRAPAWPRFIRRWTAARGPPAARNASSSWPSTASGVPSRSKARATIRPEGFRP